MPGQLNKANARQQKKREVAYARYESTARREQNKIRKMLRHMRNFNLPIGFDGRNALGLTNVAKCDPTGALSKAWDKCVTRVGVGPTKSIMTEFGRVAS